MYVERFELLTQCCHVDCCELLTQRCCVDCYELLTQCRCVDCCELLTQCCYVDCCRNGDVLTGSMMDDLHSGFSTFELQQHQHHQRHQNSLGRHSMNNNTLRSNGAAGSGANGTIYAGSPPRTPLVHLLCYSRCALVVCLDVQVCFRLSHLLCFTF